MIPNQSFSSIHALNTLPPDQVEQLVHRRRDFAFERALAEKQDALDTPEGRYRLASLMNQIPGRIHHDALGRPLSPPRPSTPKEFNIRFSLAVGAVLLILIFMAVR